MGPPGLPCTISTDTTLSRNIAFSTPAWNGFCSTTLPSSGRGGYPVSLAHGPGSFSSSGTRVHSMQQSNDAALLLDTPVQKFVEQYLVDFVSLHGTYSSGIRSPVFG
ncbi:MAG TPA: hypothetical protein VKF36_17130 [Syntrophorhabdales bacterium]|nr:hypothetical protein [Syntrophorhabdales bacterium]